MATRATRSLAQLTERFVRAVAEDPDARAVIDDWVQEALREGQPRSAVLTLAVNQVINNVAEISFNDASRRLISMTRVPVVGVNPAMFAFGALAAVSVGLVMHRIARLRREIAEVQETLDETSELAFAQAVSFCSSAVDRGDRRGMRLGELPLRQTLAVQLGATARALDSVPKFQRTILFDNQNEVGARVLAAEAALNGSVVGLNALSRLVKTIRGAGDMLSTLQTLPLDRLHVAISAMLTRTERSPDAESLEERWRKVAGRLEAIIDGVSPSVELPASTVMLQVRIDELERALKRYSAL